MDSVHSGEGRRGVLARRIVWRMEPWQKAGVTHEEWVAARLQAAALMRAVENGDPQATKLMLAMVNSPKR